ncbi:MAG: YggT family protein [Candidatus Cloacimonadota bacterium]|nr:YggT family protein [Candidatus Cloacimonadota bacterium]
MIGIGRLLITLVNIYEIIIIIRAVISWFSPDPYNPLYQLLIRVTEPVLSKFRRLIPTAGIDFSPIIVILLLDLVVKRIIISIFVG